MSEIKPEQKENLPVREVEIGQWFNPLHDYPKYPYRNDKKFSRIKKRIPTASVKNLAPLWLTLIWIGDKEDRANYDYGENTAVLFLLEEDRTPLDPLLQNDEEELEARLIQLEFINSDQMDNVGEYLPYRIEIKSPSGNIYSCKLGDDGQNEVFNLEPWSLNESDKKICNIFIPDRKSVMDRIQMRFVPIEGGDN